MFEAQRAEMCEKVKIDPSTATVADLLGNKSHLAIAAVCEFVQNTVCKLGPHDGDRQVERGGVTAEGERSGGRTKRRENGGGRTKPSRRRH